MKRELKFRAWDKAEKKWLFGYEYHNLGGFSLTGEVVLLGELSSLPLDKLFNDVEITQFTGVIDINGKEIYERDLVKDKYGKIGEVVYYQPWAGFASKYEALNPQRTIYIQLSTERNKFEKIGSIYEKQES